MPAGPAPQSMKIFRLLKGDSALGEGGRGMSNRPEQGHPPGGCATTPLKGGFSQKPSLPRCRATFDEMLASANQRFGEAQRTP